MRLLRWLRVVRDLLTGCWIEHHGIREATATEVYLRCDKCGLRSAGWTLDAKPPTPMTVPAKDNVVRFRRRA